MDMCGKDKFESTKANEDPMNYHTPNMSSDWRFGNTNFINSSMGLISTENPIALCKGDLMESSSSTSATMVDSFCPPIWDHHSSSPNMALSDLIAQNNANASSSNPLMGIRKGGLGHFRTGVERPPDMGWNHPNLMLREGVFLPISPQMLPQSLSQFPADSGFIERAARFSCFGGGNFTDMINPYNFPPMQGSQEGILGNVLKSTDKNELSMIEASKDVSATELSPSPMNTERLARSHDEAKQGIGGSGNESDEAEYSGDDGQDKPYGPDGGGGEPSSTKRIGSKKRKRNGQKAELDQVKGVSQPSNEVTNDNTEIEQKGDQIPTSTSDKPSGKHGKQGSQASDAHIEEYIHVRARRGQATNSHSLAERVRREKISERMKFLQDLVPGCSKVTGKAVMLDEIINYVQSLQRQVEFLSMKLATVNPRLDFNLDGLLAKDLLQSRAGPSSTLGFSPDMTLPFSTVHPSQSGLVQTGLRAMTNTSDALRQTISSQLMAMSGGFKDPTPQVPNPWEDELNNVVQMGFNTSAPLNSQDLSGSLPPGHMKVEL